MPTYKNNGTTQIYWRNILWEPGESRALTLFVPATDLGLTETASTPAVTPPLQLSEDVVLLAGVAQTKIIPYSARIQISAVSLTGEAVLSMGAKQIKLDANADYVSAVLPWDKVGSVGLVSAAGAMVRLLVEGVL